MDPRDKIGPLTILGLLGLASILFGIFAIIHTSIDIVRLHVHGGILVLAYSILTVFVLQICGGIFTMYLAWKMHEAQP